MVPSSPTPTPPTATKKCIDEPRSAQERSRRPPPQNGFSSASQSRSLRRRTPPPQDQDNGQLERDGTSLSSRPQRRPQQKRRLHSQLEAWEANFKRRPYHPTPGSRVWVLYGSVWQGGIVEKAYSHTSPLWIINTVNQERLWASPDHLRPFLRLSPSTTSSSSTIPTHSPPLPSPRRSRNYSLSSVAASSSSQPDSINAPALPRDSTAAARDVGDGTGRATISTQAYETMHSDPDSVRRWATAVRPQELSAYRSSEGESEVDERSTTRKNARQDVGSQ